MHAEFEAWFCIGRWGRIDRAATHAGDMHWLRGIVQTDDSGKYGLLDEKSHYYQARNSMHKHGKLLMINSATIHVVNDVLVGGLAVWGGGAPRISSDSKNFLHVIQKWREDQSQTLTQPSKALTTGGPRRRLFAICFAAPPQALRRVPTN